MKDLMRDCWFVAAIIFVIFGFITMTTIEHQDATSGITKPMPVENIVRVAVAILFFGLGLSAFINYWFYGNNIRIIGIIPERMASSRFPGKPLAKINGIPMVEHVWRNAKKCKSLDDVYVCSPDTDIIDYVKSIGGKAIYTSVHNRASDQTAEAIKTLEECKKHFDIIVMIQGDEPMVTSEMIDSAIQPLLSGQTIVSNLRARIKTDKEFRDRNTIKVVIDNKGDALYFSRQPIPDDNALIRYKQVCVIPFTRDALFKFTSLPQTTLEQSESVDMMRLVENGIKVKMVFTETETHSVDVPADIKIVERMMKKCKQS